MPSEPHSTDPMTAALTGFRDPLANDFEHAWIGMEPTFQSRKSVRKWREMSESPGGEDAYFEDRYMLDAQQRVAKAICRKYRQRQSAGKRYCMFERVERSADLDQWEVRRQCMKFHWHVPDLEPFEARLSLDPETFEFSIKPIPLAWFYDARFVKWLHHFVWRVPLRMGLSCAMAHGGGQFSISAKTYLTASLLADDIAYRVNHPELSCWIMDHPNPDDRAFRATSRRFAAFRNVLEQYWQGRFHPRLNGLLTAENALLDRGFGPAPRGDDSLMSHLSGPVGGAREVFQTNFAFGRTIRLVAQNTDPGYWQSAHPDEDGYRPDQVMRYSEGNLNRLQIAGELHVKSGKVLDTERVPELDTPLDPSMLTTEASWEDRAQTTRTSARDFVEAVLLDVHHARYLQAHPRVRITPSLHQDQLLGEAEATLRRYGGHATLDRLHAEAEKENLEASQGRIRSDRIEPEPLFWAAWHVLPPRERHAIAHEAIGGFVERVQQAASMDPRREARADPMDPRAEARDPMEWHRHRIHPVLWNALETSGLAPTDPAQREHAAWRLHRRRYLTRRPMWSQLDPVPPWLEAQER
jgi:hypothetical protein